MQQNNFSVQIKALAYKGLFKRLALILLAYGLVACGWHLRGADTSVVQAQSIYLSGKKSETYRLLEQQLERKNALAVLSEASLRLVLDRESIRRRTVAQRDGGLAQEYELTYTLDYRIEDRQGQTLRPSTTLRLLRAYNFDGSSITAADREEALIRRELQGSAARKILRQLELLQRQ